MINNYLVYLTQDFNFNLFLKILFIYLSGRGEKQAEGEASFLLSREPEVGLDPRTPGLWPELKADV